MAPQIACTVHYISDSLRDAGYTQGYNEIYAPYLIKTSRLSKTAVWHSNECPLWYWVQRSASLTRLSIGWPSLVAGIRWFPVSLSVFLMYSWAHCFYRLSRPLDAWLTG